jgi:toxin YhaV
VVVNGWTLYTYPLFDEQLDRLIDKVRAAAKADPKTYQQQPAAKLLATIRLHMLERIPANPNAPAFRQGNTLGKDNRQWFRAKFHERYRLFFRFSTQHKVIIYAWVNDERTLRTQGAKDDPYALFEAMLKAGHPPASLDALLKASKRMPGPD